MNLLKSALRSVSCVIILGAGWAGAASPRPAMETLRQAAEVSPEASFDGNTRPVMAVWSPSVAPVLASAANRRSFTGVSVSAEAGLAHGSIERSEAPEKPRGGAFKRGIKDLLGTVGSCAAFGALIGFFVGLFGSPTLIAGTLSGAIIGATIGAIFGVAGMLMEWGS